MSSINITKRGKYYQYRFEGSPIDGKRKQYSKSGFRTKKEALEAGTKALAEYNNSGIVFNPSTISVADYLHYWSKTGLKDGYKDTTICAYNRIIEGKIIPYIGQYRLSSLTVASVNEYINKLKEDHYSSISVNSIRCVLSSALKYAVFPLEYIKSNPVDYITITNFDNHERTERQALTKEEWNKIIDLYTPKDIHYISLMIGYYCGVRISECYGLLWSDVDFKNSTISITKQLYVENKQYKFVAPKYNSKRIIRIGDNLKYALLRLREYQKSYKKEYGEFYYTTTIDDSGIIHSSNEKIEGKEIEPINVTECGKIQNVEFFRTVVNTVKKELNITLDYHTLRHTHATMLIESGANMKAVQTRLGHKNIKTTMNVYAHTTDNMESEIAELFDKLNE